MTICVNGSTSEGVTNLDVWSQHVSKGKFIPNKGKNAVDVKRKKEKNIKEK